MSSWQERHEEWASEIRDYNIAKEVLKTLWKHNKDVSLEEIIYFLRLHAFDADYVHSVE